MVAGLWGKKIGMTQIFADDKVVPVTVIDASGWIVTQIKTDANDGYSAVQIARLKDRYAKQEFSKEWLTKLSHYFVFVKEVKYKQSDDNSSLVVGEKADLIKFLTADQLVDVRGVTKGAGFAGGMKRHGFAGGRASHGSTLGRRPGSLSFQRSQGRVIKGKRLPGHMGCENQVIKNLKVVKIYQEENLVLVKGAVPGKAGSLVFVKKA